MGKFCSRCGAEVDNESRFCSSCGTPTIQDQQDKLQQDTLLEKSSVQSIQGASCEMDSTLQDMFFKNHGRLNRLRYFKRSLALWLIEVMLFVGFVFILDLDYEDNAVDVLSLCITLIALYPGYCLIVRRIEDLDRKRSDAVAITIVGAVVALFNLSDLSSLAQRGLAVAYLFFLIYLLVKDGTHGPNKYGEDPLHR